MRELNVLPGQKYKEAAKTVHVKRAVSSQLTKTNDETTKSKCDRRAVKCQSSADKTEAIG